MKPLPEERAKMTAIQREIAERLVAKHWHFSMIYHRSCYFRPRTLITWPDGSKHRSDSWNRPFIKVLPSGRIVRN